MIMVLWIMVMMAKMINDMTVLVLILIVDVLNYLLFAEFVKRIQHSQVLPNVSEFCSIAESVHIKFKPKYRLISLKQKFYINVYIENECK